MMYKIPALQWNVGKITMFFFFVTDNEREGDKNKANGTFSSCLL